MKRIYQRCILTAAVALLLFAAVMLLPTEASATEIIHSGRCGENLRWALDDAGTLTISGEGEMEDYTSDPYAKLGLQPPWKDYCAQISTVVIEEGVTDIGKYAFAYSFSCLTDIYIPTTMTSIDKDAFWDCRNLNAVHISDMRDWCKIDFISERSNPLYYADELYLNGEPVTEVVIPAGTEYIREGAFRGNTKITSLTIPESVKYIGEEAFYGCTQLTEVAILGDVGSFGRRVFGNCNNIVRMTLPRVGENNDEFYHLGYLFADAESWEIAEYVPESLKTVILNGACTTVHSYAFTGCVNLTEIIISDGVTSIGNSAFASCFGLTNISIPDSVTSVEYLAFNGCSSLEYNEYDQMKYLGNSKNPYAVLVSAQSNSMTARTIHENTKVICDNAFRYCSNLTSITIPESVSYIGLNAFDGCSSLNEVHISDLAAWCGIQFSKNKSNPLYYAKRLYLNDELVTDAVIPSGVSCIDRYAFYNCSDLTSIVIPDSVTSIGDQAFANCSGLKDIVIPDSVTSVGAGALYGCVSLEALTIPFVGAGYMESGSQSGSVYLLGYLFGEKDYEGAKRASQFYFDSLEYNSNTGRSSPGWTTVSYYVPRSLKTVTVTGGTNGDYYLPAGAFSQCDSITSVVLGKNVRYILDRAFAYCDGLTTVTFLDRGRSIRPDAFLLCSNLWHVLWEGSGLVYDIPVQSWEFNGKYYETADMAQEFLEATHHYDCTGNEVLDAENKICVLCCSHMLDDAEIVSPTCTEQGYTTGVCSLCGAMVQVDFVEALGHNGEWVTEREATCSEDGRMTLACTLCGETDTEIIPATGHAYKSYHTDATCTEDGCTTHTCTNCGDTYTDDYEPAWGHSYGAWTAVDDRYHKRTCETCDGEEKVFHNCQAEVTEPTCLVGGYTTHFCTECGHCYVDNQTPATGHSFVDGQCTHCGGKKYLLGDINMDGEVNIFDANLAAAYYNEIKDLTEDQLLVGDVNGDGEVNIFDANLIAAYYNEVIEKFPIE